MTLVYFSVSGLDLLGFLDQSLNKEDKSELIQWILRLQRTQSENSSCNNISDFGFRGSPWFLGAEWNLYSNNPNFNHDLSNLAMTYTALNTLKILGYNFDELEKAGIVDQLSSLQIKPDGNIRSAIGSREADMRYMYCACAICHLLNDWSGIDCDMAATFILESRSYDGGFAQSPYFESHGGSTYCAIASLVMMNRLHLLDRPEDTIKWLLKRQISGFQGRINKSADTCYSFWIGASLSILGAEKFINKDLLLGFLGSTEFEKAGGFGKEPGDFPDLLHSYMAIAGLSIIGFKKLGQLDCLLNAKST